MQRRDLLVRTIGEVIEILGKRFRVTSIKENGEVILEELKDGEEFGNSVQRKNPDKAKYA